MAAAPLTNWLLDSDPALRWQVERDVTHEPPEVWEATRARVATEGFGARLLALQDPDGQWAGGAFFPAGLRLRRPRGGRGAGSPGRRRRGRSTRCGSGASIPPSCASAARPNCSPRTAAGSTTTCPTGAARSTAASTPGPSRTGSGSAPTSPASSTGSSSTDWPTAAGTASGSRARRDRRSTRLSTRSRGCWTTTPPPVARTVPARPGIAGEEYLLTRGLFRRLSTGRAGGTVGRPLRVSDAVVLQRAQCRRVLPAAVAARRRETRSAHGGRDRTHPGRPAARRHVAADPPLPGRVWFEVDAPVGEPSKWLTLFGIRVLDWWDGHR